MSRNYGEKKLSQEYKLETHKNIGSGLLGQVGLVGSDQKYSHSVSLSYKLSLAIVYGDRRIL